MCLQLQHGNEHLELFLDNRDPTWQDFIQRVSTLGEWGCNITLQGAADFFHVKIKLLNNVGQFSMVSWREATEETPTLTLGHILEDHYVSLVTPEQSKCQ